MDSRPVRLRALGTVTRMQPGYAAFMASVVDGDIPLAGMAELFIEIAPGNEIYRVADAALKATSARPGSEVVEREFGFLELHSESTQAINEAARVMLDLLGLAEQERIRPRIVSHQIVTNVTSYQAQLINRSRRHGSLVVPGQTVLMLEVTPAAYVLSAANETERAGDVQIIEVDPIGIHGRLLVSGQESQVRAAADAAEAVIESIHGVPQEE